MERRSVAAMRSARMYDAAASPSSCSTRLRYTALWSSRSAGTIGWLHTLQQRGGPRRFLEQYGERRYVGVPLDKRRTQAEPGERFLVERPHFGCDARTVIVDTQRAAILKLPDHMTCQVNLADGFDRQRREINGWVPVMVAAADVDVIDVAQDAATGPLGDRGDELPFGNARMLVLHVRRWILDENLPLQIRLSLLDMPADDRERLFGHWQRQQVRKIDAAHHAPREMLRDQPGFDTLYDPPNPGWSL